MSDAELGLDVIETPTMIVGVRGADVEVTPLRVRHWPAFTRIARTLNLDRELRGPTDFAAMIAVDGPAVIDLIALLIDRPSEWVGELYADDLIKLASAAWDVNASFFFRGLLPVIALEGSNLGQSIGRLLSKHLSPTDIAETTSSTTP